MGRTSDAQAKVFLFLFPIFTIRITKCNVLQAFETCNLPDHAQFDELSLLCYLIAREDKYSAVLVLWLDLLLFDPEFRVIVAWRRCPNSGLT